MRPTPSPRWSLDYSFCATLSPHLDFLFITELPLQRVPALEQPPPQAP